MKNWNFKKKTNENEIKLNISKCIKINVSFLWKTEHAVFMTLY